MANKDDQKTPPTSTEAETAAERIDSLRRKAEDGELGQDLLEDVSGGTFNQPSIHTDGVAHTDGVTHTDSP